MTDDTEIGRLSLVSTSYIYCGNVDTGAKFMLQFTTGQQRFVGPLLVPLYSDLEDHILNTWVKEVETP